MICEHCAREIEYGDDGWTDADAPALVFCWGQDGEEDVPEGADPHQRHEPELTPAERFEQHHMGRSASSPSYDELPGGDLEGVMAMMREIDAANPRA